MKKPWLVFYGVLLCEVGSSCGRISSSPIDVESQSSALLAAQCEAQSSKEGVELCFARFEACLSASNDHLECRRITEACLKAQEPGRPAERPPSSQDGCKDQLACLERVRSRAIEQQWPRERYEAVIQSECGGFVTDASCTETPGRPPITCEQQLACLEGVRARAIAEQWPRERYERAIQSECGGYVTDATCGRGSDRCREQIACIGRVRERAAAGNWSREQYERAVRAECGGFVTHASCGGATDHRRPAERPQHPLSVEEPALTACRARAEACLSAGWAATCAESVQQCIREALSVVFEARCGELREQCALRGQDCTQVAKICAKGVSEPPEAGTCSGPR